MCGVIQCCLSSAIAPSGSIRGPMFFPEDGAASFWLLADAAIEYAGMALHLDNLIVAALLHRFALQATDPTSALNCMVAATTRSR